MLNKDFIKWVVIAFVIATPIAYYTVQKWLETFAYKTTLSWWIFAFPGLRTGNCIIDCELAELAGCNDKPG